MNRKTRFDDPYSNSPPKAYWRAICRNIHYGFDWITFVLFTSFWIGLGLLTLLANFHMGLVFSAFFATIVHHHYGLMREEHEQRERRIH